MERYRITLRGGFSYFDLGGGGGGWKNIWGGGAFSSKLIQLRLNSIYNIEISSWEVLTYGIYARVNLFSQNERASEFWENKLTSA